VYVRVTTIGHVPAIVSVLVTTRFASEVQLSEIATPNASKPATVVTAADAPEAEQPLTFVAAIVPVTVGAVLSPILNVCVNVV
jgi:hypothetical protein